jgi:hypothetical protein
MTKRESEKKSSKTNKKRAKLRQPRREQPPPQKEVFAAVVSSPTMSAEDSSQQVARIQYSRDAKRSQYLQTINNNEYDSESSVSGIVSDSDSECEKDHFSIIDGIASSCCSSRTESAAVSSNNMRYAGMTDSSSDSENDSDYDVSSESNAGDVDGDREESNQCHLQLIEEGLDEHLKSPVCNKSAGMTQTMLTRYIRFLVWLWKQIGAAILVQGGFDVCYLISAFIVQHSQLLPKYYSHLKEAYLFKASTIIDHNENFQVLVHWYAVYRVHKDTFPVDPSQLYTINLIIKSMRKAFSRERKIQEATSTDNTIEGLVKARKWPLGGLQELSDAVGSQMEWARRLCVKGCIISLSIYNLFMQVFMSSLFTSK